LKLRALQKEKAVWEAVNRKREALSKVF